MAPSNKYLEATITEGVVPTEELWWRGRERPAQNDTSDEEPKEQRDFLVPDFAHPLDYLSDLGEAVENLGTGLLGSLTGTSGGGSESSLVLLLAAATFAALGIGLIAYLVMQYFKYSNNGGSIGKATAGYEMTSNVPRQSKSPIVQSTNISDPTDSSLNI